MQIVFVIGDDADKAAFTGVLLAFGWLADEVLDLRVPVTGRGTEALLPLGLRLC